MLARHSYEHAIKLPLLSSLFGAGIWQDSGYFIIYLDEGLQSFVKPFNTENSRVFEFALSNVNVLVNTVFNLVKKLPTINVMDKSTDITNASGDECRKQMKDFHQHFLALVSRIMLFMRRLETAKITVDRGVSWCKNTMPMLGVIV